ncbi:MAG: cobalamin biosynthesis protein, partial [Deinococcus sp.]|nr:cobalamin biosynthesis protein [Deinococcus sp.]
MRLPWPLETALLALLLKPLFAFRMLLEEVGAVETALQRSLEAGRLQLSRIVSRDTSALSEAQVREAALESLSENLADSLLAPLFWYVLLGLPGAALYRFANTADALWGYHGRWEWGGKWAAKADDLLSYLPARITGLFLLAIPLAREKIPWARLVREAHKTPSPNSGWPMAALALRGSANCGTSSVGRMIGPATRCGKRVVQPGSVKGATSTSPGRRRPASSMRRSTRAGPRA